MALYYRIWHVISYIDEDLLIFQAGFVGGLCPSAARRASCAVSSLQHVTSQVAKPAVWRWSAQSE